MIFARNIYLYNKNTPVFFSAKKHLIMILLLFVFKTAAFTRKKAIKGEYVYTSK